MFRARQETARSAKARKSTYISRVSATLQIPEDRIYLPNRYLPEDLDTDPIMPVYLDIRGVRNPTTKGLNIRYRVACSPGWECGFTLMFDCTVVPSEIIQAILYDAGRLAGIGNGRNIGMGRFEVIKFGLIEEHEVLAKVIN
jgi:hypothetical protein